MRTTNINYCSDLKSNINIRQLDLISKILCEIDRQHPGTKANTNQYNTIIKAVDMIVDVFAQDKQSMEASNPLESWLLSGDTGLSSKFMASVLSGHNMKRNDHPYDASDFGRCVRLLEAEPELRKKLSLMNNHGPYWQILVKNWDKLESLYKDDVNNVNGIETYTKI